MNLRPNLDQASRAALEDLGLAELVDRTHELQALLIEEPMPS